MIRALLGPYRKDANAYQEGLTAWLSQDGSAEAQAAGIVIGETLLMWRHRLKKGGDGV